jgi:cell division protein FtsW
VEYWLHPETDPGSAGYQLLQSLYAIGSGGTLGVGLGNSRQKYLYLPESQNDFIFAIICEEFGWIGATAVIVLFGLLLWRGYVIALNAADRFGTLLAAGITTQIAVQTFLNLGVVTGLLPITGASLPFFSYGGTALLIQLAEMGILLSISREMPAPREG